MNNWTSRDLQLNLSFLSGRKALVFADGVNADREATDWQSHEMMIDGNPLNIHLAPAGGWTAIVE